MKDGQAMKYHKEWIQEFVLEVNESVTFSRSCIMTLPKGNS